MTADLFISYAWRSDQHPQWVRLLAIQLKALGYDVLLDANVDYGESLTGFMRRVTDARHVLLIVDENYVDRADTIPGSGVAAENRWIASVYDDRPDNWLSVVFKDNPEFVLPAWLTEKNPKGLDFNYDAASPSDGPGSEQIEDLWRWVEGLPANRDAATPMATLRARAARLEHHELRSAPSQWRDPALSGEARFAYADASSGTFVWGLGDSEFGFNVTECGHESVYVYNDPAQIRAVGVIRSEGVELDELAAQLSPGRSVVAHVGQAVVLMNTHGRLAIVELLEVQREETGERYVAPHVTFRWRVVDDF